MNDVEQIIGPLFIIIILCLIRATLRDILDELRKHGGKQ